MYGVTMQVRASDCLAFDRFIPTSTMNFISLVYGGDCLLQVAGTATQATYWSFVSGVAFRGNNALRRAGIGFGFVIWANPWLRNVVMHMTPGATPTITKTWSLYESTVVTDGSSAAYPYYDTSVMCNAIGMTLGQIDSAAEQVSARLPRSTANVLLGASRPDDTVPFSWFTGPMTYSDFLPQGPASNGAQCLAMNCTVGHFQPVQCASSAPWPTLSLCQATGALSGSTSFMSSAITARHNNHRRDHVDQQRLHWRLPGELHGIG